MRYTSTDVVFEEVPLSLNPHACAFASGLLGIHIDTEDEWTWGRIDLQTGYERKADGSLGEPIYERLEETDPLYPVLILALERENWRTRFIDDAAFDASVAHGEYLADQYADLRREEHA